MQVGWLIDAAAFESYHDELVAAVKRNGYTVVSISRPPMPYHWRDVPSLYRNAFPTGACVVTHGDVDLVRCVRADGLWTPGVFASVEKYFCSHYYTHLGKYLLNERYAMLPFGELPRCINFLVKTFGVDDKVFVRPDSPLKSFTGQVISRDEFEKDFEFLGFNGFPVESLVVVSVPQRIRSEWRYVVGGGDVIAGSQYKIDGEMVSLEANDMESLRFARSVIVSGFSPDPVWILDIGKSEAGSYHIVEVGGFSFAGLYACNKNLVVQHVSRIAREICLASSATIEPR